MQDILSVQPNSQILCVSGNHPLNLWKYNINIFCDNNKQIFTNGAIPVVYYQNQWRWVGHLKQLGLLTLGETLEVAASYNLEEEENDQFIIQGGDNREQGAVLKEEDLDENSELIEQDSNNKWIRHTGIPKELTSRQATLLLPKHSNLSSLQPAQPIMSIQVTTQLLALATTTSGQTGGTTGQSLGQTGSTTGQGTGGGAAIAGSLSSSAPIATPQSINTRFWASLHHYTNPSRPPSGGGPPGGSGRGGGGPPGRQPPTGGPVPPAGSAGGAQQPIPVAVDIKSMGGLLQVFTGDRSLAEDFIEEVKGFLHLNQDIARYNSPIKKVAFMLTLIKGPTIAGWAHNVGNWLDTLNSTVNNIPAVWDQFLHKFSEQFQDSQKENRACNDIKRCTMRFPKVDDYIACFKDLL